MALTRGFKETIQARVKKDPAFRRALLKDAIETMLTGDIDTGKAVMRDYINATIGFEKLGSLTKRPPKSLMRMFGKDGNPRADNLFAVIHHLQKKEGVGFEVTTTKA